MINASLPKTAFETIFKSMLKLSEYFGIAIVYAICRALRKKIDDKRFQHFKISKRRIADSMLCKKLHRDLEISAHKSERFSNIWSKLRNKYFLRQWTKEICKRKVTTWSHQLFSRICTISWKISSQKVIDQEEDESSEKFTTSRPSETSKNVSKYKNL